MGLTPLQGLVIGARSGDVDPGAAHLPAQRQGAGLSVADIDTLLNKQSGLKGLAGVNDFRELEERRGAGDASAQLLASEVYVHRLERLVGAYLAILGRLDLLTSPATVSGRTTQRCARLWESSFGGLGMSMEPELNHHSLTGHPGHRPRRLPPSPSPWSPRRGARHREGNRHSPPRPTDPRPLPTTPNPDAELTDNTFADADSQAETHSARRPACSRGFLYMHQVANWARQQEVTYT